MYYVYIHHLKNVVKVATDVISLFLCMPVCVCVCLISVPSLPLFHSSDPLFFLSSMLDIVYESIEGRTNDIFRWYNSHFYILSSHIRVSLCVFEWRLAFSHIVFFLRLLLSFLESMFDVEMSVLDQGFSATKYICLFQSNLVKPCCRFYPELFSI